MICVECGANIDSTSSYLPGDIVKLTTCNFCGKHADRYLETDSVMKFIDLALQERKVYRHLIFNPSKPAHPPSDDASATGSKSKSSFLENFRNRLVGSWGMILASLIFLLNLRLMETMCKTAEGVCEGQRMFFITLSQLTFGKLTMLAHFTAMFAQQLAQLFFTMISAKLFFAFRSPAKRAKASSTRSFVLISQRILKAQLLSQYASVFTLILMVWGYRSTFARIIYLLILSSNAMGISTVLGSSYWWGIIIVTISNRLSHLVISDTIVVQGILEK